MPTKETMPGDKLQDHIFSSYLHLRYGAAIIGALLPLIIYAVALVSG